MFRAADAARGSLLDILAELQPKRRQAAPDVDRAAPRLQSFGGVAAERLSGRVESLSQADPDLDLSIARVPAGRERRAAVGGEVAQAFLDQAELDRLADVARRPALLEDDQPRVLDVDADERLAPERLDERDRPAQRADETVAPRPRVLGAHADDGVRGQLQRRQQTRRVRGLDERTSRVSR